MTEDQSLGSQLMTNKFKKKNGRLVQDKLGGFSGNGTGQFHHLNNPGPGHSKSMSVGNQQIQLSQTANQVNNLGNHNRKLTPSKAQTIMAPNGQSSSYQGMLNNAKNIYDKKRGNLTNHSRANTIDVSKHEKDSRKNMKRKDRMGTIESDNLGNTGSGQVSNIMGMNYN